MKFKWGEVDSHFTEMYDLFIAFASYEERCLSFAKNMPHGKVKQALIFHISEYEEYTSKYRIRLNELLKCKNVSSEVVELSQKKPIESIDSICKSLDMYLLNSELSNIVIDITTFTHEMLLILLMLLKQRYVNICVTIVYSNAKDYDPTEDGSDGVNSKWLSKGIDDIRSILGYPGDLLPTKHLHLVIIVGYEYDRALSVISEMEPTSLSLGFGKSESFTAEIRGKEGKHFGAHEHFEEVVRDALYVVPEDKVYTFNISCNDPEKAKHEIKEHLKQIGNEIKDKNVVMFAMNNKLSTLGVGMLALEYQDLQLCYAPALVYNYDNYSKPGDYCYLFKLD